MPVWRPGCVGHLHSVGAVCTQQIGPIHCGIYLPCGVNTRSRKIEGGHSSERPTATVERTGRSIVAGTWGCAVIVMVGSAASAAVAYDYLGEHWGLGLATGIAVDIALCVALVGDRRLYAHGLTSNWGRALRITTALMSLVLNAGVAFATGHYFLAFLHSFLPVLLVVLTEYGQDVLLQFTGLARAQDVSPAATNLAPASLPAVTQQTPATAHLAGTPVSPDTRGGWRDPSNTRREIRKARGEEFSWVTSHVFHKTGDHARPGRVDCPADRQPEGALQDQQNAGRLHGPGCCRLPGRCGPAKSASVAY